MMDCELFAQSGSDNLEHGLSILRAGNSDMGSKAYVIASDRPDVHLPHPDDAPDGIGQAEPAKLEWSRR